jgi:hypothetical protein
MSGGFDMRTRRGSLLNGTTFGDAILMYKPGDVVKPVTVMDPFFTGVVRSVDTKTNKITVAWGGGPESQHDVDEIMPMPFISGSKVASTRRMKSEDITDLTATNPPMAQFCGDPGVHGLDEPRGGGFSIMKDLAYQLHDEANNFADVDPRIATSRIERKSSVSAKMASKMVQVVVELGGQQGHYIVDGGYRARSQADLSETIVKALKAKIMRGMAGMFGPELQGVDIEAPDKNTMDSIQDKLATGSKATLVFDTGSDRYKVATQASVDCGALALDGLRSRRAMYWCAPDRTFRLTQQEQANGTAMCPQCRCDMNKERFTRSEKLLVCPSCGFKVPTSKAVTQIEVKVPENVSVQVTKTDEQGNEVSGQMVAKSKHELVVKSLHDAQAECSCGNWTFTRTGPATKAELEKEFQKHLKGKKAGFEGRRGRLAYADPVNLADLPRMTLSQIADIVYTDWGKKVNYAAKPYLEAMASLNNVSDMYGADSGTSIVAYFLSNATSWRGDVARVVKKELQRRIR